jgi:tetratricopeptide (TPR) repeat protein/TolB-like protein/DNA-binding winged helix-turn-helix (wHTH) protein
VPLHRGFKLGALEVKPTEGLITGKNGNIPVHPHAMEVLLFIARQPGRLVSRRKIMQAVWGSNPVSQDTLTRNIAELRHALGDDPHHPVYIQTVPRRGYRLVAQVIPLEADPNEQDDDPRPGVLRRWWRELRRRRVVNVTIAYVGGAWLVVSVADVLLPLLMDQPTGAITMLLVLAIMGAPVALAMAWMLQVTSGRIEIEPAVSPRGIAGRFALLAALVLATGFVGYVTYSVVKPPFVDGRVPVAVLPMSYIGESRNEAFCDGLTEELTYILGRIPELKVANKRSTQALVRGLLPVNEIASRLHVTHVLEGSCRYDSNQLRITAQLVEASSGFSEWSQAYQVTPTTAFRVQEDIARSVARAMRLVLSSVTDDTLAAEPTSVGAAYSAYLEARGYLAKPREPESLRLAQSLFEKAVELDPDYGKALAGLCETHLAWYELELAARHFADAEQACNRALTKDRGEVDIRLALAELYRRAGRYADALDLFQTAIRMDSTIPEGYVGEARTLAALERPEQAEGVFKLAIQENPVYWVSINAYGAFLFSRGRYDEAAEQFRICASLDPSSDGAYNNLGAARYMAGDFTGAAEAFEHSERINPNGAALANQATMNFYSGKFDMAELVYRRAMEHTPEDFRLWGSLGDSLWEAQKKADALEAYGRAAGLVRSQLDINPEDQEARAELAHFMARMGQPDQAGELIFLAVAAAPSNMYVRYYEALVRAGLGEKDRAVEAVQAALEAGYPAALLRADPGLASLRSDTVFRKLLNLP